MYLYKMQALYLVSIELGWHYFYVLVVFLWVHVAMDSVKRTLRNIMDNLRQAEFNRVKHFLNDMGEIPKSKLETTDRDDIVDVIVQTYTEENAGQIVLKILRELKLNQMAKNLETELNSENSALESARAGQNLQYVSVSALKSRLIPTSFQLPSPFHTLPSFFYYQPIFICFLSSHSLLKL